MFNVEQALEPGLRWSTNITVRTFYRYDGGQSRFTCCNGTQALFFTLDNSSIILQMAGQQLYFVGGEAGGGFGGKVDVTVEPIAILAAMLTGRPVSFIYNRHEEM